MYLNPGKKQIAEYSSTKVLRFWKSGSTVLLNDRLVVTLAWYGSSTKELLVGPHRKFVASIAFCYPLSKEGIIWLARLSQVIRSVLTLEVTMIHYQFLKAGVCSCR